MKKLLKIYTIGLLLLLSLPIFAIINSMPTADAHTPPWSVPTISYINVAPNPAGVGQSVTVNFWLMMPPPNAGTTNGDRWSNMTVKVTKPDSTTETLGPFTTDNTGGTTTQFVPTQEGNYTFQMIFGGQTLANVNPIPGAAPNAYVGDYFQPSQSNIATLTVQSTPVPMIPDNPFPTEYWLRPINAQNNNWYVIGGNWLGLGGSLTGTGGYGWYGANSNYNPYTTAPKSAHILWTKPEGFGGQIGGEYGGGETDSYWAERQYERMFNPIIMQGILYYELYPGSHENPEGWLAVDLHTGETLYTQTTPVSATNTQMILRCGQILNYVSPNAFGGRAYIWTVGTPASVKAASGTATWNMHEASTGTYILSIVNGTSSMTLTKDEGGDLLGYYVNSSTANAFHSPTLNMWNSTQCIIEGTDGAAAWEWYPYQNAQISFSLGIMWSVPLATNISGVPFTPNLGITTLDTDVVIMTATPNAPSNNYNAGYIYEAGYNTHTGALLWIKNQTQTPFTKLNGSGQNGALLSGDGVYLESNQNTLTITAYSEQTGNKVWATALPDPNTYDVYLTNGFIADTTVYFFGLGGDIYALNLADGAVLWHQTTTAILGPSGSDTPYGVWPIWTQGESVTIADGVLYFPIGHEYSPPLFRGAREICLNITNGEPIWNILGVFVDCPAPISDGVMTTVNGYDNQIYAFGKGPTQTTVSAPQVGVTTTTPVTITGTVTDISAGASQQAVAANFPNGLPAVSDESQSQFMEAVYEQQPMPTNITGVPVTLNVVDSNGNYRSIGTAVSNIYGTYSYTWTPDISGDYTVIADFAGTNSYYPSTASTAFHASESSATTAPTSVPVTDLATMSGLTIGIAAATAAIIIAIAIVGILLLRKKP